jgi:chromosome segregation protein
MQLREVAAQVDTGSQDKQLQLGLLGSSDAVYQQHNRELAVAEGELGRLDRELQQAKFELLQFDSAVARLRTEASGYEVDQKTSIHRHDALAADLRRPPSSRRRRPSGRREAAEKLEETLAERPARRRRPRRRSRPSPA